MLKKISPALLVAVFMLAPAVRAAEEETPLAKEMNIMDDSLKALKKIIAKPAENAKSLELIEKIQHAVVASKSMTPVEIKNVAQADRAKWLVEYRKEMVAVLEHMCKIEVAIVDGDNAKAETLFKSIKKMEDDGHEVYAPDE